MTPSTETPYTRTGSEPPLDAQSASYSLNRGELTQSIDGKTFRQLFGRVYDVDFFMIAEYSTS